MELKVKKLRPDAVLPSLGTGGAAGIDLHVLYRVVLRPEETARLPTGLALQIPDGYFGWIEPRSSAFQRGVLAWGKIDSDYRGEVYVVVQNNGSKLVLLEPGMSVAQLTLVAHARFDVVEVAELDPSARGAGGFGSTGRNLTDAHLAEPRGL